MMPRLGKATVEKIAINAVMAGALPTAMPMLIAGVEALLDPLSTFGTFEVEHRVLVAVLHRQRTDPRAAPHQRELTARSVPAIWRTRRSAERWG